MPTYLKAEVDKPITITPRWADIQESQYGPQLKLKDAEDRVLSVQAKYGPKLVRLGILTGDESGYTPTGKTLVYTRRDRAASDIQVEGEGQPITPANIWGAVNSGSVIPLAAKSSAWTWEQLVRAMELSLVEAARITPARLKPATEDILKVGLSLFIAADRSRVVIPETAVPSTFAEPPKVLTPKEDDDDALPF